MLYPLIRPILFTLDPEQAHDLSLSLAGLLSSQRHLAHSFRTLLSRPRYSPVRVAGLTFPNPIGLAAGLDKNAVAPLAWYAFGFGFAELGTITPRPQSGKPQPRLFRLKSQHALINRMGFNNDGARAVAKRLQTQLESNLRPPMPLGISIGKNADTPPEAAAEDYAFAAAVLAPHADYLAINVSSPNTPGLRSLQSPKDLSHIISSVRDAAPNKPLFVKLAPELTGDDLAEILDSSLTSGATGFIASNTLATHGANRQPEGGLSGPPLMLHSLRLLESIRKHIGPTPPLIATGGISNAATAQSFLSAGANLLELYTALIYQGPLLPARLTRALA